MMYDDLDSRCFNSEIRQILHKKNEIHEQYNEWEILNLLWAVASDE